MILLKYSLLLRASAVKKCSVVGILYTPETMRQTIINFLIKQAFHVKVMATRITIGQDPRQECRKILHFYFQSEELAILLNYKTTLITPPFIRNYKVVFDLNYKKFCRNSLHILLTRLLPFNRQHGNYLITKDTLKLARLVLTLLQVQVYWLWIGTAGLNYS